MEFSLFGTEVSDDAKSRIQQLTGVPVDGEIQQPISAACEAVMGQRRRQRCRTFRMTVSYFAV